MTQREIAEKFGVPQCDVSVAIKYSEETIDPIGKKEVVTSKRGKIKVNEYDVDDVASALVKLYIGRSDKHLASAREWSDKANAIIQMRKGER